MAKKIDLTSIYTSEEKYTVLQLLKKFIDVVEKFDVGQPLYRHTLYCELGKVSFINDDASEYNIVYQENKWFVYADGISRGRMDWLINRSIGTYFTPSGEIAQYSVATVFDHESNGQFSISYYENATNVVTEPLTGSSTDVINDVVTTTLF